MTTCDVPQCDRERIMSWRPIGHERGYRVCREHTDRDHDPQDPFDLCDVFGLARIQSEANRKRSEAEKQRTRTEEGTFEPEPEVGQSVLPVAKAEPGKQAKAAAAKVNMGAVARGDKPTGPRTCGCGTPLGKGRRLCDECRTKRRRATMRAYMRPYMRVRRRGPVERATSRLSPHKATDAPVARKKVAGRTYFADRR
jgi:hypothetical protein